MSGANDFLGHMAASSRARSESGCGISSINPPWS